VEPRKEKEEDKLIEFDMRGTSHDFQMDST
jgi:hypothetical protein